MLLILGVAVLICDNEGGRRGERIGERETKEGETGGV